MRTLAKVEKELTDLAIQSVQFAAERYEWVQELGDVSRLSEEDIRVRVGIASGRAYLRFCRQVYSHQVAAVAYPINWWEAFKDRWFPKWLKRRYPVRQKRIEWRAVLRDFPVDQTKYRIVVHMLDMDTHQFVVSEGPSDG